MGRVVRIPFIVTVIVAALLLPGCQTEECPPGVTDSIFCRATLMDATACVPDAPCQPGGNPCRVGVTRCEDDGPRCEEIGSLPRGTSCGEGQACDAEGACTVCIEGAVCSTGDPCATGRIDCLSGAPVCVRSETLTGTLCGSIGVCGEEGCSECIEGVVCNTGNPCTTGRVRCADEETTICEETEDLPAGVRCGDRICSDAGSCETCVDGAPCNDGNPCTTGRTDCGSGAAVCVSAEDLPPGTGCGSLGLCSGAGEWSGLRCRRGEHSKCICFMGRDAAEMASATPCFAGWRAEQG